MPASLPPPPSPSHILRIHAAHVTHVSFSSDNERLLSGDVSGNVNVTSTLSLRPIAAWKAHSDGILGIQEWEKTIITHGRDNKLHVWAAVFASPAVTDTAAVDEIIPDLLYSLDVNALNFCRFSLLPLDIRDASSSSSTSGSALIAVPNLVESSLADIWELPSCMRINAAVGKLENPESGLKAWHPDNDGRGNAKTGILMSLHLFNKGGLYLLSAYESGDVCLRVRTASPAEKTIEGCGWQLLWRVKNHVESVMSMAVSTDCTFALTTSADHIVARYDLFSDTEDRFRKYKTKQPGNASVSIKSDGRVCAVGGWDGKVRLFSTKSFKPLGTLAYHAKSCQSLAFAQPFSDVGGVTDAGEGEVTEEDLEKRSRWLAVGAQDNRISIWRLVDFESKKK